MLFKYLAVLLLLALNPVKARKFPSPQITAIEPTLTSQGSLVSIKGSGFIKNLPQAHKVLAKQGKKKIKLNVLSSNASTLIVETPQAINFGDYQIAVKIKTKLLRSKASKAFQQLQIRPKAPAKPSLKFQVIKEQNELEEIFENTDYLHSYSVLKTGENLVKNYYYQNGFKSIESAASVFYYLPETELEQELELKQESPLDTYAKEVLSDKKYNISKFTKTQKHNLEKSFFVETPHSERYLEYKVQLKPVIISEIHAKEPEAITLLNQGQENFNLKTCKVYDSIKLRHHFEEDLIIKAKESFVLEKNLGINDTGDEMKLECPGFSTSLAF